MADECTNVSTVELSVFCHWVEYGLAVEHFLGVVNLLQADAESIYSSLIE